MPDSRIGTLSLHLRTYLEADEGEALRPLAERFVRATLERCVELLDARHPGRLVLLRELPLHWQLETPQLDDIGESAEMAAALADAIERQLPPARLDPMPTAAGPIAFADEAQWRASHLLARAHGRVAWFHAALEEESAGDPLAALAGPSRQVLALATLRHLAVADVLAPVLAAQPAAAVAVLAAAWGYDEFAPVHDVGSPAALHPHPHAQALAATAAAWPALARAARTLALHVHAAALLDIAPHDAPARTLAAAAQSLAATVQAPRAEAPRDRWAAPAPQATPQDGPTGDASSGAVIESPRTRVAGVFCLLPLVQELGLAESLWQACLPEGTLLAASLRAFAGADVADDPAWAYIAGDSGLAAPTSIDADALCAVAEATCAELVQALPRRGLAELPPLHLARVELAGAPVLVGLAQGSPFACFAWPADTPDRTTQGLRTLLSAWPATAVTSAAPALARLDTSGRLRPVADAAPTRPWSPQEAATGRGWSAALAALVVGAPATLFAARLGPDAVAVEAAADFARHWISRPGRVRRVDERLDILIAADEARDLALRRAGLDRDPGWMPWLGRTVRFVIEPR